MGLSSLHLDAFIAAARTRNFSQAATELHITQSALSQRIKSLEEDLNQTLFLRMPRGVKLTDAGIRLLRYCQARHSLEEEVLAELSGPTQGGLGGSIRIGGYSSIVRSVLMPALSPLLRDNPDVQPHIQNAEMRELPELLLSGSVDFVVMDRPFPRGDLESIKLGEEEIVMIDGRENPAPEGVYLDHDPDDSTTAHYLSQQGHEVPNFRRAFLDEVYAVLDGAALGMGRAVISRHLVESDPRVVILDDFETMRVPVLLHFFRQPFYTALHGAVIETLKTRVPALLGG
jgi:DNA-binding transcriptional LysR family regulator